MPPLPTRLAGAVLCLLALGACSDFAISRLFPEPPASSYDAKTFQVRAQPQSESVEGARVTPEVTSAAWEGGQARHA